MTPRRTATTCVPQKNLGLRPAVAHCCVLGCGSSAWNVIWSMDHPVRTAPIIRIRHDERTRCVPAGGCNPTTCMRVPCVARGRVGVSSWTTRARPVPGAYTGSETWTSCLAVHVHAASAVLPSRPAPSFLSFFGSHRSEKYSTGTINSRVDRATTSQLARNLGWTLENHT